MRSGTALSRCGSASWWHPARAAVDGQRGSIPAEILTLLILFQQSGSQSFKGFYTQHVQMALRQEFPRLVSYTCFVELMSRFLLPLAIYLHTQRGACRGISFID